MIARTSRVTNRPIATVEKYYKDNRGQGWGVTAQRLGIKPGSPEFHALKKDDTGLLSKGKSQGQKKNDKDNNKPGNVQSNSGSAPDSVERGGFMKNKRLMFFIVGFLIVFSLSTFAETTKLKSIGQYTFVRVRGEVPTQDVMKRLVDRYAEDIKYGFDLAGAGDLYLPFMDQLKSASFEEKSLPVGDKLRWMLFRSQGKVKVAQDIEWAGKAPLEVFAFNVKQG